MIRYNLRQDWNKKRRKGINPNPILVEGEHDAIIDMKAWEKVEIINKQMSKKQQRRYSIEALLTGILKCPACGSAMTISRTTNTLKDGTKKVEGYYACGAWKSKGTVVCNSNRIKINKADKYVLDKVMELANKEIVLKKIVNKEIEKLSYRRQEIQQDIDILEGEPVPFEVVKEVFGKFGEIFRELGTKEQRKQVIHLLISKVIMNKAREIDSINIEINDEVITYLIKDGLPKQQDNPYFFSLIGIIHMNLRIVI